MTRRVPRSTSERVGAAPETPARARAAWPSLRLRIDWRFAAGQVLLTALGVALALAGSAWWGDRQERARERSELRNALDAARVSERRLRQFIHEDSTSAAVNTRLWSARASVPDDSLLQLIVDGGWYSDTRPVVTPFAAMIANGDIHLVRDARLRAMLPTYVGEIEARVREVDRLDAFMKQVWAQYPPLLLLPPAAQGRGHAGRLRADPEVWRVSYLNRDILRNMVSQGRIMLRETTALRQELERVLGERPVPLPQPRFRRDSF